MSGNKPEDARFREYGSTKTDGSAVDTSKRTPGTKLNEWTMLRYNPYVFTAGSDEWDPAGMSGIYAEVNDIIAGAVIDTSDSSAAEVALPQAPEGYEFFWESDSEFAQVSEDGAKLALIRPAYGEAPIEATVKLYTRKADNKDVGAEKSIAFEITPTSNTENTFTISGKALLSVAAEAEQIVTLKVKLGDAVIKSQEIVFAPGDTEQAYVMENIPAGSYVISAETSNPDYNILTEAEEITGAKGDDIAYNVEVKKMAAIKVVNESFDTFLPTVTSADGFTSGAYTANGTETANIGAGNSVYRVTKEDGQTVAKNTGVSFKLNDMLPEGSDLSNTKSFRFSFDVLMESIDYLPSAYSYFDLAANTDNAGNDKADAARFVRWGVHTGWKQFNFFTATNARINGDRTQFNKNNTMANRWYRMTADVDLENKTIYVTAADRDKDMEILNGKPFTIAASDAEGVNANYPTAVETGDLYFNIYMDKNGDTSNKLEYYFDNITLEYSDFE